MANVRFNILPDGTDRADRPGNWQVIFKVQAMLNGGEMDYCRETMPGSMSRDAIKQWTEKQCEKHRLQGAVIERW
jgi:hypothetical protein